MEKLLTIQELSKRLKVNPETVRRQMRKGIIPSIRIGKQILRFDYQEVLSALKGKRDPRVKESLEPTIADVFKQTDTKPETVSKDLEAVEPPRYLEKLGNLDDLDIEKLERDLKG